MLSGAFAPFFYGLLMTYSYLVKGPMYKRPFHLIADDGITSLCGQAKQGEDGTVKLNSAPDPMNRAFICPKCKQAEQGGERVVELV